MWNKIKAYFIQLGRQIIITAVQEWDNIKAILRYLWRDKIDLLFFVATTALATYYIVWQSATYDHIALAFCALWMLGAIIRMGYLIENK